MIKLYASIAIILYMTNLSFADDTIEISCVVNELGSGSYKRSFLVNKTKHNTSEMTFAGVYAGTRWTEFKDNKIIIYWKNNGAPITIDIATGEYFEGLSATGKCMYGR